MPSRLKILLLSALSAFVLTAVAGAAPSNIDVFLVSETETTITLGWNPSEDIDSQHFRVNGTYVSWTRDVLRNTVRFTKNTPCYGQPGCYEIVAQRVVDSGSYPQPPPPPPPPPTEPGTVVLVDKPFQCNRYPQPLDLDLVKVTITENSPAPYDAIRLNGRPGECTGRIGRIEVDTWKADGIKIGEAAHDLVIEGGYLNCHARHQYPNGLYLHQDGIQAMGGTNISLRNLRIDCETANNAAIYLNRGANGAALPTEGDWPTNVVCESCVITRGGDNDNVVRIHSTIRSGVRNSTVYGCGDGDGKSCAGPPIAIRGDPVVDPVTEGTLVLHTASCRDTFDNDFDGLTDADDPECLDDLDNQEAE